MAEKRKRRSFSRTVSRADLSAGNADAKEMTRGGRKVNRLKYDPTPEGRHYAVRVLPSTKFDPQNAGEFIELVRDPNQPGMLVVTHNEVPGWTDKFNFAMCPAKTYPEAGVACPLCEAVSELYNMFDRLGFDDSQRKKVLGRYRRTTQAHVNGFVRGGETTTVTLDDGRVVEKVPVVQVIRMTRDEYGDMVDRMDKKYGDITALYADEGGRDIDIKATKTGPETFQVEYKVSIEDKCDIIPDPDENEDVIEAILHQCYNIKELNELPDEKGMKKLEAMAALIRERLAIAEETMGDGDDDEEDDDGDAGAADPKRARLSRDTSKKKTAKDADDEEEEDDDEEEEEEDEEEEEPDPKSKRRALTRGPTSAKGKGDKDDKALKTQKKGNGAVAMTDDGLPIPEEVPEDKRHCYTYFIKGLAVCRQCPVIVDCMTTAKKLGRTDEERAERHGVEVSA